MTKKSTIWLDRALVFGPFLALFTDEASYKAEMKKLKIKDPPPWLLDGANACVHRLEHSVNGVMCLVCMRHNPDHSPFERISILVHEAVHVWQNFKTYIGENDPSTEFEAYSIQNIVHTLLEEYERQTKPVRKCKKKTS